jgi:hypothetical protein
VASVENMDLGLRYIPAIGVRLRDVEGGIMFSRDRQKARLAAMHPILLFGVRVDIGAVVVEHVALNVGLARSTEKGKFIGSQTRVIAINVGITTDITRSRSFQ